MRLPLDDSTLDPRREPARRAPIPAPMRLALVLLLLAGALATWLFWLFGPLAVYIIAILVVLGLWIGHLWRAKGTPGKLATVAGELLALGLVMMASRIFLTHESLPENFIMLYLLAMAELFLFTWSVLLFIGAGIWHAFSKVKGSLPADEAQSDNRAFRRRAIAIATFLAAILAGSCVTSLLSWSSSARLQSVRYGQPRPIELTSLHQITENNGMWFPESASLDGGAFIPSSNTCLVAKVSLEAEELDAYLSGQPFEWVEIDENLHDVSDLPYSEQVLFRRMGWELDGRSQSLYAIADTGSFVPSQLCTVLVRLQPGGTATLYVYYEEL